MLKKINVLNPLLGNELPFIPFAIKNIMPNYKFTTHVYEANENATFDLKYYENIKVKKTQQYNVNTLYRFIFP